jgi:hypothetical protein
MPATFDEMTEPSTAIAKTKGTLIAPVYSDDIKDIGFSDIPTPRLQLTQGSTDIVKKTPDGMPDIKAGQYAVPDDESGYVVADVVTIIPISLSVFWSAWLERDGDKVPFRWPVDKNDPENRPHELANKTYSYILWIPRYGLIDKKTKAIEWHDYGVMAQWDLTRSNTGAAKNINAALKKYGFKKVALNVGSKFNETANSFYSVTVAPSDLTVDQVTDIIATAPIF